MSEVTWIRAPELAARAAGYEPVGVPWIGPEPTTCYLCGRPIRPGEMHSEAKLPSSFVDQPGAGWGGSHHLCGFCPLVFKRQGPDGAPLGNTLQKTNTLVCKDAIYPMNKNVHLVWFLLHTPEPPFAMCITTAKSQHLIWKAPVTLDHEAMQLQVGDSRLLIRRGFLFGQLIPAATRLGGALEKLLGRKRAPHPFASIRNNDAPVGAATMHPRIMEAVGDDPSLHEDLSVVMQATNGETWAMGLLLRQNAIEPETPDPLFTHDKKGDKQ